MDHPRRERDRPQDNPARMIPPSTILDTIARWITYLLTKPSSGYEPFTPSDPITLSRVLQPGDVLLVEGNHKLASAIKYLTQSTWSHSALYVGNFAGTSSADEEPNVLIEANLSDGVVAVPLSKYQSFNTRICRPAGLSLEDRRKVVAYALDRLGHRYDTRNVFDLARYLFPTPPVPVRWRRRMIALGSGDPTRTICSTLIAGAFESVRFPVLPRIEIVPDESRALSNYSRREILHIRDRSLFVPRDFDVSPYFSIIKPTIECGFDYRTLHWAEQPDPETPQSGGVKKNQDTVIL